MRLLGGTIHLIYDSTDVDKAIVLKRLDQKFENISGINCDNDCTQQDVSEYYELFQKQCEHLAPETVDSCKDYYKKEVRDFLEPS